MYAIYGNIYHQYAPNVSIYTIHGSYGLWMNLSYGMVHFHHVWPWTPSWALLANMRHGRHHKAPQGSQSEGTSEEASAAPNHLPQIPGSLRKISTAILWWTGIQKHTQICRPIESMDLPMQESCLVYSCGSITNLIQPDTSHGLAPNTFLRVHNWPTKPWPIRPSQHPLQHVREKKCSHLNRSLVSASNSTLSLRLPAESATKFDPFPHELRT